MRVRPLAALATAIVIGVGAITLAGLLIGEDSGPLFLVSSLFLRLVVVTAGMTVLIGILNLVGVHLTRITRRRHGWPYSLVMFASLVGVIALTVSERAANTPDSQANSLMLLETVQVSIESALVGLVAFALVYGAYRMMRRRVTWTALLFTLAVLVVLVGALPLPGLSAAAEVRAWLLAVPVNAGARGILLGIALAVVVAGVRVLIGQDRSYRE